MLGFEFSWHKKIIRIIMNEEKMNLRFESFNSPNILMVAK